MCLSKSFNDDINKLEKDIVSVFPISISNGEFEIINDNVISSNDKIINKNKEDYSLEMSLQGDFDVMFRIIYLSEKYCI